MKIAVVGPGALGCLIATRLHLLGQSPVLIDYKQDRATHLNSEGIYYSSPANIEKTHFPIKTTLACSVTEQFDIVIFCVKSYSLKRTISSCKSLLSKDTISLFMQNGISHLKPNIKTETPICFGSTTEGAYLVDTNHVHHAGTGRTSLGFLTKPSPKALRKLNRLGEIFNEGSLKAEITPAINNVIWEKLLINIGINGLTAIHNCNNGTLLENSELKTRMITAVEEAKRVAEAYDIAFQADPILRVFEVCNKTAGNISSMLQDVRARRKTEIEAINGALISLAEKNKLDCPENQRIVDQIREIETSYE